MHKREKIGRLLCRKNNQPSMSSQKNSQKNVAARTHQHHQNLNTPQLTPSLTPNVNHLMEPDVDLGPVQTWSMPLNPFHVHLSESERVWPSVVLPLQRRPPAQPDQWEPVSAPVNKRVQTGFYLQRCRFDSYRLRQEIRNNLSCF